MTTKWINSLFLWWPQVSDLVIILNQRRAIEAFTKGGNLTLGGNFTIAVGPMGRWAPAFFSSSIYLEIFLHFKFWCKLQLSVVWFILTRIYEKIVSVRVVSRGLKRQYKLAHYLFPIITWQWFQNLMWFTQEIYVCEVNFSRSVLF